MVYFTSDQHFYHKNIIQLSKRPFLNIDDMHHNLIINWNRKVKSDDSIVVIGDFSFGNVEQTKSILRALDGHKILIRGNHDRSLAAMKDCGFDEVHNSLEMKLDGYHLFLRHIPPSSLGGERQFKKEFQDSVPKYYDYMLVGHVHERWAREGKIINVGVDVRKFTPVTLAELLAIS